MDRDFIVIAQVQSNEITCCIPSKKQKDSVGRQDGGTVLLDKKRKIRGKTRGKKVIPKLGSPTV